MSVKAQALVWDMECPAEWNGLKFLAHHKYVLIAYADHADHQGKNIYPAINTIRKKTGYKSERTVQAITRQLGEMGILLPDGTGPRGTNRYRLAFDTGGAKIAPLQYMRGAVDDSSLGAIPSGAIPSGANIAPELKEPEPLFLYKYNNSELSLVWQQTKEKLREQFTATQFETWIDSTEALNTDDRSITVGAVNQYAATWLEQRVKTQAEGILGVYVNFVIMEAEEE